MLIPPNIHSGPVPFGTHARWFGPTTSDTRLDAILDGTTAAAQDLAPDPPAPGALSGPGPSDAHVIPAALPTGVRCPAGVAPGATLRGRRW